MGFLSHAFQMHEAGFSSWPGWMHCGRHRSSRQDQQSRETQKRKSASLMFRIPGHFASHDSNSWSILSGLPPNITVILFQEAMVRITGLLAEDLRKELYQLWEVRFCALAKHCWHVCTPSTTDLLLTVTVMTTAVLFTWYRSMRVSRVMRPGWWRSWTSWRWSYRLMSTRSWRGTRADCRSSSPPLKVSSRSLSFMYKTVVLFSF